MIDKNFISTYSKIRFNPTTPSPENIIIEDIAHALSLMARANGHFKSFYSVAQHCIACCFEAKERKYPSYIQLASLLHDGSEAYICDITRPLKRQLKDYTSYERVLEEIIYTKFLHRLPTKEEFTLIREIDNDMLYHEFKTFHGDILYDKEPEILYKIQDKFIDFKETENKFLDLYHKLSKEI